MKMPAFTWVFMNGPILFIYLSMVSVNFSVSLKNLGTKISQSFSQAVFYIIHWIKMEHLHLGKGRRPSILLCFHVTISTLLFCVVMM